MTNEGKSRSIGGYSIIDAHAEDLITLLAQRRDEKRVTELMFANTNFIVSCRTMIHRLSGPETLIVNDGIGLDLVSWLFYKRFFKDNLNGTDFTPRFFAELDQLTRVFLLGAKSDAVHGAAHALAAIPNVVVVGFANGYDDMADGDAVVESIAREAPDVLLVALGDPLQAEWIVAHRHRHRVPLVIGVGALFDFMSGRIPRAPILMRRARLEWLFRLVHEPRRLLKRYSIDLAKFFAHCLRTHRDERGAARGSPGRAS